MRFLLTSKKGSLILRKRELVLDKFQILQTHLKTQHTAWHSADNPTRHLQSRPRDEDDKSQCGKKLLTAPLHLKKFWPSEHIPPEHSPANRSRYCWRSRVLRFPTSAMVWLLPTFLHGVLHLFPAVCHVLAGVTNPFPGSLCDCSYNTENVWGLFFF